MGERTCKVDECDRPAGIPGTARGWCRRHYYRFQTYGDPLAEAKQAAPYGDTPCAVADCGGKVLARGWCTTHYNRWQNHGHPEALAQTTEAHRQARARERQTGVRFCRTCAEYKALAEFGKDKSRADGLRGHCKRCLSDAQNAKRAQEPERWREYHRARYAINPEPARRYARAYNQRNPDYQWHRRLRSAYGMTPDDWQRMHDEQGGRCLICHKEPAKLAVDHCHSTGKVRGLLCSWCNTSLGFVEAVGLERIAQYLAGELVPTSS